MSERDLVTDEGVDEGSAAGTVEGPDSGSDHPEGAPGQGGPGGGGPVDPAQAAAPIDVDTEESAAAQGPGQQYQVGEG